MLSCVGDMSYPENHLRTLFMES